VFVFYHMQPRSNTKHDGPSLFGVQGWAHLPSFDHGVGDPVEKDIYVSPMYDSDTLNQLKLMLNFCGSVLLRDA
jgi:hypothetical protein